MVDMLAINRICFPDFLVPDVDTENTELFKSSLVRYDDEGEDSPGLRFYLIFENFFSSILELVTLTELTNMMQC